MSLEEKIALNHLIISKIFEFLPLSELKILRLVNKIWENSIRYEIKKRNNLEFKGFRVNKNNSSKLVNFLKYYQKRDEELPKNSEFYDLPCICRNFRLENISLIKDSPGSNFFDNHGLDISELKLEINFNHLFPIEQFEIFFSNYLPNLTSLSIENLPEQILTSKEIKFTEPCCLINLRKFSFGHPDKDLEIEFGFNFFSEIFKNAQNINELLINLRLENQILTVLKSFKENGNVKNLIHFETLLITADILSELIILSKKYSLFLKVFNVQEFLPMYTQDSQLFQDFINLQKRNLETLWIWEGGPLRSANFIFPKMTNLKSLDIGIDDIDTSYGTLNYSFQFPVLEKLYLRINDGDIWDEIFSPVENSKPCPNVNLLQLPSDLYHSNVLLRVMDIFPKIKKLRINICNFTENPRDKKGVLKEPSIESYLKALWASNLWSKTINELHLQLFTPIPYTESVFCQKNQNNDTTDIINYGISNLKNLKKLTIGYESYGVLLDFKSYAYPKACFTDKIGEEFISMKKSLQILNISKHLIQFTDEMKENIKKNIASFNIIKEKLLKV